MPGMGKEIPKEETYNKYGAIRGELGSMLWGTWRVRENAFFGNSGRASLIEGRFVYAV